MTTAIILYPTNTDRRVVPTAMCTLTCRMLSEGTSLVAIVVVLLLCSLCHSVESGDTYQTETVVFRFVGPTHQCPSHQSRSGVGILQLDDRFVVSRGVLGCRFGKRCHQLDMYVTSPQRCTIAVPGDHNDDDNCRLVRYQSHRLVYVRLFDTPVRPTIARVVYSLLFCVRRHDQTDCYTGPVVTIDDVRSCIYC